MLIEQLAIKISEWFPELGGRSVAVMDAEITKNNLPTLPICMVSPIRELPSVNQQGKTMQIVEEFIIEFWLTPKKLVKEDKTESAYWACYDYADIRNRLIYHIDSGEIGNVVTSYLGLTFETTPYAQVLAFRFSFTQGFCYTKTAEKVCSPDVFKDGKPARFKVVTCPKTDICKD